MATLHHPYTGHVDLNQFTRRLIQDALQEATAGYWLTRAATFDAVGTPTADQVAQACRASAAVADWYDVDLAIDAVLAEHRTTQLVTS